MGKDKLLLFTADFAVNSAFILRIKFTAINQSNPLT
jgi:hypothetical protein